MTKPRVFTIGHSDRTLEQFIEIIERSAIRLVVDVRSNPASARYPWFERAALTQALETQGFSYRWMREFGGRKPPFSKEDEHTGLSKEYRSYAVAMNGAKFRELCDELVQMASSTNIVLLCAEKSPSDCHRSLLADKLMLLGAKIVHIVDHETAFDHSLNPSISVDDEGAVLYQENQLPLL